MMDALWSSLRRTARRLLARPGFTAVVVATLALGIGANTAVFSFVNALLLRPMPFERPEELMQVQVVVDGEPGRLTAREMATLKRDAGSFEDLAAYNPSQYNLTGVGAPENLLTTINTENLFSVLGVELLHGEPWPADVEKIIEYDIILGHALWTRMGADPAIVGTTLTLDGAVYRINGVAPPGLRFPNEAMLFRALTRWGDEEWLDIRRALVVGRLAEGATVDAARAELSEIADRLARDFPDSNRGVRFEVTSLREAYLGPTRPYLLLLLAAVALVLLLACANVVNLLLARASGRSREIALQLALGASRFRVARELVGESVVLGLLGGVVGALLAWISVPLLVTLVRIDLPLWMSVEIDATVLAFTFAVSIVAGAAAGLAPAIQSTGPGLVGWLRDGAKGSAGVGSARSRGALVVVETALALVLLIAVGVTLETLWRLRATELGFTSENLLTFRTDPPWTNYSTREQTSRFHRLAVEELEALPGVRAAAMNTNPPLAAHAAPTESIRVFGQSVDEVEKNPFVNLQIVSPNYLQVLQVSLLQGDAFTSFDDARQYSKAVVSRSLAERFFPDSDAIGQRFQLGSRMTFSDEDETEGRWITIVGVAADVHHQTVSSAGSLDVYLSSEQFFAGDGYFLVRMDEASSTEALMAYQDAVTDAIQRVDPEQSIFDVTPMTHRIDDRIWQQRLSGVLLLAFGIVALVLAGVGIYGVLSVALHERTRELGIRVALGAGRGDVLRATVLGSMKQVAVGLAAGLGVAFFAVRSLSSFAVDLGAANPLLYVSAAVVLAGIGALASYLPARRASRVSPIVALRSE